LGKKKLAQQRRIGGKSPPQKSAGRKELLNCLKGGEKSPVLIP